MLEGDIQADGDTVFVSAITMPTFNGAAGPDLNFVESALEYLGNGAASPTVSFSGLLMDIIACESLSCLEGFAFQTNDDFSFDSSPIYGNTNEPYNPNNWELTAKNVESTPEPASVLGLLAFGAVGGSMLKRK